MKNAEFHDCFCVTTNQRVIAVLIFSYFCSCNFTIISVILFFQFCWAVLFWDVFLMTPWHIAISSLIRDYRDSFICTPECQYWRRAWWYHWPLLQHRCPWLFIASFPGLWEIGSDVWVLCSSFPPVYRGKMRVTGLYFVLYVTTVIMDKGLYLFTLH